MDVKEFLVSEGVDVSKLQHVLRQIGFNLSHFQNIKEDDSGELLDLFHKAVEIDSRSTTRLTKMELRSKLEKFKRTQKFSNGQPSNSRSSLGTRESGRSHRSLNSFSELKDIKTSTRELKLGKVKFFDPAKGFGYISSYEDKKDCFVHISKLVCPEIKEDQIVVFNTTESKKKPGELDAVNVDAKIPVFIYNETSTSKSYAYPLLENHFDQKIPLTNRGELGFKKISAFSQSANWRVSVIENQAIRDTVQVLYGKKILANLLISPSEYGEAVEFLGELLQNDIDPNTAVTLYGEIIDKIANKSILEVNDDLKYLKGLSFFDVLFAKSKASLSKISFLLWIQGELSKLPAPVEQVEVDLWRFEILPSFNWKDLQRVLLKLISEQGATKLVEESYRHLIKEGWNISNEEDLKTVINFLESLRSLFPSILLDEANFNCDDYRFYVELFNNGFVGKLSVDRIKEHIGKLKSDQEKVDFIEKLPSAEIISVYSLFPNLAPYKENYIAGLVENEFSELDFVCFDLESNGERIDEFAWKTASASGCNNDFVDIGEGISALVTLLNNDLLIIGQNVKVFDLPILVNHGATPAPDTIWDTLEVEMLLNPQRISYALKTKHSAAADAELTYRLFRNQIARIITSSADLTLVKELLPSKVLETINRISKSPYLPGLEYGYFDNQSNDFFRPNPSNQNISEQTFKNLKEKLEEEGNKVVIAPEFLWDTLSHQFNFTFYSDSKTLGFCLNREKIEVNMENEKLLKSILLRFVDSCSLKGSPPYFQHLPMAIRLKLTGEQATLVCDNIVIDFESINQQPICIKPTDIQTVKQHWNQISELKVIVVGNELYDLTSKLQLGQDLDFATIFDRLKNEPIWLQMSGGKSFISLVQSHCRQLGITDFPEFVQNIWLEKVGKGKFKVWCNLNFEACINDLPIKEVYYIDWVDETINKANTFIIRPDARKSGYVAEQKRVNPESLYRRLYWVYQFKLFEGIGNTNNPKVLIINDEFEFAMLSAFARKKGYFIPDINSALARQVELLHTHRSPNKLLITSFQALDQVISSNYIGPIDFIWDSFLLQEKLQMLKGKISVDLQDNEEQREDDYQTDIKLVQTDYDLFSLIKLHKPLIDYYYKMLFDNNPDSQLFLCDTRLTDYYGIEKSLNLNAESVQMWYKETEYDNDKKIADEFFSTVHENADTDFNIDEAKEILRQIFLIPDGGGVPYPWHPYQHPCLNEILPAKKDLLISLPTGAGKSLLFQGPALFRSAFSCKLSIVISPLRALMQDQVDALWEKGFHSNVEFLSGDKSQVEIRDIYRRISGGEITLLYITPERFRSRAFENCLLTRLDADSGLEYVVFDEAHCISQWGQEFRPDYLNAGRKVAGFSGIFQMRKLLFSATISDQVFEEISTLMPGVVSVEGTEKSYNPVRDHIKMDFKHNVVEDDRLLEIANYLKSGRFNPILSRAIIFVKSRKKVEECSLIMSDSLKDTYGADCGFAEKVGGFHAGMDADDRKDTYQKYKTGEIVILFATKAFGMGMDIPNIHFVTHYSPPSTFEDFLQEVGRAGRNEKNRLEAGFDNVENPIKTLCLTTHNDFGKLKDQLHESRISWHEIKDIKQVLEEYIARFKPLQSDNEIPVAVPFNLYSNAKGIVNDDLDNKFRIALHWLERLERINLGYFTITHLEFDTESLNNLAGRINECPDKDCEMVCNAITKLIPDKTENSKVIQISIASLRSYSKLSLENLFKALLKSHSAGILKLLQDVVIEPTKIRSNETDYCKDLYNENQKYPALQVVFSLASEILKSVPSNGSKFFEGDDLDKFVKDSIDDNIDFVTLPWTKKSAGDPQKKEAADYVKDIIKKRSKHAFTVIRLLGKTKHETKMEKVTDGNQKVRIRQSVFNGYHKKEEWSKKITQLKNDCIKLLDYVANEYFDKNKKKFNWPDIISELKFSGNVQYLSDLLFILSILGYSKTAGLLPTGIEIYLTSIDRVDETDLQSRDKKIFDEFEDTRKVRELKLIALEVLAGFQKGGLGGDATSIRIKQDTFIRKYFGCNSLESLLQLLQDELPLNDPLLVKWRGDAINAEEDRLNNEQRKVYDADINQHINVMAGPGSGKTHTLTLRVARLVHHIGTNPEEILVLAYNRAVVSELKERLGRLFSDLGYGNLAKRIKIFTFHGLAKRFCLNEVKGEPFDEWENILLKQLVNAPGQIMNQLGPLKHILVDEFQDINNVRINLLNKLHKLTDSYLFIIGDPNQSIYGYERLKEGGSMSPWPYYGNFNEIFKPTQFELYDNHRSYPAILELASQILTLPTEHQHLIPKPTRLPDDNFILNYAQVIDRTKQSIDWWNQISALMEERVGQRPYKQIAILFRTNNEVYRGFQKVKGLNLPNIRIRIQGNLPYEFTRIRECHAVILFLKSKFGQQIPLNFKQNFRVFIDELISRNQNWNHFYIRLLNAIVLEYLEEHDEQLMFDSLLEFIEELTHRDDGQLYKIYEKHIDKIVSAIHEIEIVLTTMHKVKGLEFDCVIIAPSYSNLAYNEFEEMSEKNIEDTLNEEKRLAFVAFTRARFRLLAFNFEREIALRNNQPYILPERYKVHLGVPADPGINKLNIGWSAKEFNFNRGINDYIKKGLKSGDAVRIKLTRHGIFDFYEIIDSKGNAVGQLSTPQGKPNESRYKKQMAIRKDRLNGFLINEIVQFSYEETLVSDEKNGTTYAANWCAQAINQGYIYLVDFAGFGVPND